jgi:ketosteroid isomerase-like protein
VRFTLTGPARSDTDLIREVNAAVAAGDVQTVRERLHEDVVWEHNIGGGSPEEGVYRGRDSVTALFERIMEPWEVMRLDVGEISDLGNGVYQIEGELHFKHRSSAVEVLEPFVQRVEIRDRLLVRCEFAYGGSVREFGHHLAAREERSR